MKRKIIIVLLILIFISGCKNIENKNNTSTGENTSETEELIDYSELESNNEVKTVEPETHYDVEDKTILEQKCNSDVCMRMDSFGMLGDIGAANLVLTKVNNNLTTGTFLIKFDTTCELSEYTLNYDFTTKTEETYEIQFSCKDMLKTKGYEVTIIK